MTFGEWMRQERKRKGITQAELARMTGTTQTSISAYERGRWNPYKPTQRKITAALNLAKNRMEMPDSPATIKAKQPPGSHGKSNGDRLRGMDDEELVFIIQCQVADCPKPYPERDCYQCKLNWLKEPAKEDEPTDPDQAELTVAG